MVFSTSYGQLRVSIAANMAMSVIAVSANGELIDDNLVRVD